MSEKTTRFPKSSFSEAVLEEHAGRFDIPRMFKYVDRCPNIRNPSILNAAENSYVVQGLPAHKMDTVVEIYTKKLTPFDAYFLVPRWPIRVLMAQLDMDQEMASVLKRLCNTMRDIEPTEYNRRVLERIHSDSGSITTTTIVNGKKVQTTTQPLQADLKVDYSCYNDTLAQVKRYLSAKTIGKMPPELGKEFVKIPEFMVKRNWTGPQFNTCYKKACARFK